DHDPENHEFLKDLSAGQIRAIPAFKEVLPGLQATSERLAKQQDGRPRLYILKDSLVEADQALVEKGHPTCLEEEIPRYVWEPAREGRAPKEAPHKVYDHACDALRYAVCRADNIGRRIGRGA